MRVVSLLPAATEIVAALGSEGALAGISHECDWPPSVQRLLRVTTTRVDPTQASGVIDAGVQRLGAAGQAVIGIDAELLRRLKPDLILTQDLCDVCAVSDGTVQALASALQPAPRLLPLRARTLEGVFADIAAVGQALDLADDAEELIAGLRYRLERMVRIDRKVPPRVVCIEWLDPIYLAGHWVPEMIEAAGGRDVAAAPGDHSRVVELAQLEDLAPEAVLVAPCGLDLQRADQEYRAFENRVRLQGGRPPSEWPSRVWLIDGNAYSSRPGPRLVDGVRRFAAALREEEMPGLHLANRP